MTPGTPVIPARRLLEVEHVVADPPTTTLCGLDITDITEMWIAWPHGGITTCATCSTGQAALIAPDLFGETA